MNDPRDIPFENLPEVGVAIKRGDFGLHCGLLYRWGDEVRLLHLAFHHLLCDQPPDLSYLWAVVPEDELDVYNARAFAAWAKVVGEAGASIPYGFNMDGLVLDEQGQLLPSPVGRGLTCATFVLALFRCFQIKAPAAVETWPTREEDAVWKSSIIALLKARNADPEHIQALESETLQARFRPDEVIGSVSSSGWSFNYEQARELADAILVELDNPHG